MNSLIKKCQQAFSNTGGGLAKVIPGFVTREPQIDLASAIAKIIGQKTMLVAEAGTGTGKTFAYLIPCLLSGKKAIISTATKTLQDQLFEKDLPLLKKALAVPTRVHNLKGRANYLCKERLQVHGETGGFANPETAHEILTIRKKLPTLKIGERSELTEIKEDSPVWPFVTSTEDNCLGAECPQYNSCFLVLARRRALEADVIVINHHLFFADSRLKGDGLGELLPAVDMVVFDEAHKLIDIATEFYGEHKGSRQLLDLIDELIKIWPVLDLPQRPLKQLRLDLEKTISALLFSLEKEEEKASWELIKKNPIFIIHWHEMHALIEAFIHCIDEASLEEEERILHCRHLLEAYKTVMLRYNAPQTTWIRWIERYKHSFILHLTPFEVAKSFLTQLEARGSAYLFTSATLTMNANFDCFIKPLGLEKAETLILPSPFDFKKQALLYLPRGLPDTSSLNYYDLLLEKILPIINACQGRCFFLFTSHKALKLVALKLANTLNFPLLIQGEEAKPILLARFRQLGNAVLLGTATFWEGVDVKGEALSCVIIDKLPFPSPFDPIIKGKSTWLKTQGQSGFHALSLPMAVLALKQGIGRLIRDVEDKGILVLADPRLTGRSYGQQIFASLPLLQRTRDPEKVYTFIQQFDIKNEIISD